MGDWVASTKLEDVEHRGTVGVFAVLTTERKAA